MKRFAVCLALSALGCEGGFGSGSSSGSGGSGPGAGGGPAINCETDTVGGVALARRITSQEYSNILEDVLGLEGSDKYPAAYGESTTGFSTEPAISVIGEQGVEQLMLAAEEVAELLEPRIEELLPCAPDANSGCAQNFVDIFGRLLFRHRLADQVRGEVLQVFDEELADGATFSEAVSVMAAMMLQMPQFLYVLEAPTEPGEDRQRTGVELATRLSFHFWNSAPDEALLDKAEAGDLDDPAEVEFETARLFDDARSDRGFARFIREWGQTPELSMNAKDAASFPYLDDSFVASINESFDRFASNQFRSRRDIASLLTSPTAFVDDNLAAFFGLDAVGDWMEVDLDSTRYSGVMTQPALMAALAHSSEPSYVHRGRFIRKRLLCDEISPPPGNAMSEFAKLEPPEDPTGKDLSAVVRAGLVCSGCHGLIDPPGLAFEHFDAMGDYRDTYPSGKAIDTTGVLEGTDITFDGPTDLMAQMAPLEAVRNCVARQVFRYTSGRLETATDVCAVEEITNTLEESGGELAAAFIAATQTDTFHYRRGE